MSIFKPLNKLFILFLVPKISSVFCVSQSHNVDNVDNYRRMFGDCQWMFVDEDDTGYQLQLNVKLVSRR